MSGKKLSAGVLALVLGGAAVEANSDEAALAFILQAFASEEQVTSKRARLTVRRDAVETHYQIERILPDRLRLHWRRDGVEGELVVVGEETFMRDAEGWRASPRVPLFEAPLSISSMLENRLDNVVEHGPVEAEGIVQRLFTGRISWLAGYTRNEGEIRIVIERDSALPRRLDFEGTCGVVRCSFEHVLTYDPAIAIDVPIP